MSWFCSSAGTEPSSTFPKKGGATIMYHAFPRHLSRTCLAFVDKFILRTCVKILKAVLKGLPFQVYFVGAHVFLQRFRNGDCAVFFLVVFEDGDDGSACSYGG